MWCFDVFWPVLFFVSLEVIVSYRKHWEHTIAIYGFLWSYLEPLEELLHRELPKVIASMCWTLHIPLPLPGETLAFPLSFILTFTFLGCIVIS